jgi:signal peptide peptidase SppA
VASDLITLPELPISRARLGDYFDVWAIQERRGLAMRDAFRSMDWARHLAEWERARDERLARERADLGGDSKPRKPFAMTTRGIAVIQLSGSLMKQVSSFDEGTSTVHVRRQIRAAANDSDVRGIMLVIDSPGGTVSGTAELADDVAGAAGIKPVWAYCDDLCASAAYWVGSQAERISANRTAAVGSIGVYTVVHDMSKLADSEGILVHVIRAGEFKGAGTPGTEITDAQLAEWQKRVDGIAEHFVGAVAKGRKLTKAEAKQLATGQVWSAAEAVDLRLIDAVESLDEALAALDKRIESQAKGKMKMSDQAASPVAATLEELEAACPGAGSDFLMAQLKAKATVDAASKAWTKQLVADRDAANKAKADAEAKAAEAEKARADAEAKAAAAANPPKPPKGHDGIPEGWAGATGGGVSAEADIRARIDEKVKGGMSRYEATRAVLREDAELRGQLRQQHNAKYPNHARA